MFLGNEEKVFVIYIDQMVGIVGKDLIGAREMVRDGIGELLEYARPAGMPLAIEPLHPMYAADRACVNTMEHANDLCDELGMGVGIAVDVYHVWWDPHLKRELQRAGGMVAHRSTPVDEDDEPRLAARPGEVVHRDELLAALAASAGASCSVSICRSVRGITGVLNEPDSRSSP